MGIHRMGGSRVEGTSRWLRALKKVVSRPAVMTHPWNTKDLIFPDEALTALARLKVNTVVTLDLEFGDPHSAIDAGVEIIGLGAPSLCRRGKNRHTEPT